MRGPVTEDQYTIPLAQGDIKRKGSHVTVVATGHLVGDAIATARALTKDDIDFEI